MHPGPVTSNSSPATGSDEVLVRVEGVSKKFCRSLKKSLWYGVCDIAGELNPFAKHGARGMEHGGDSAEGRSVSPATSYLPPVTLDGLRPGEFWAVNDVSFELRRGECLGLIGHNGAGKTTLLKMLNGLIKPDRGRIEMNGRVGALIALGAGFNPILTGRENIYINGSVLGLSKKEIDEKIEEIIDFAEIGDFIDSPVQNYSSGMSVRLGFSIASSLSPDVLILDEVLAVGDIGFVVKCLNKIRDIASDAAVILVSHNMQSISGFCSRVIVLEKGNKVKDVSEVADAIDYYYEASPTNIAEVGTGEVKLLKCEIIDEKKPVKQIALAFEITDQISGAECQVNITDLSGLAIVGIPIHHSKEAGKKIFEPGLHKFNIIFDSSELNAGKYYCTLVFRNPNTKIIYYRIQGVASFQNSGNKCYGALIARPAVAMI
jgi:lipopolysaccharide transport system ATP-binding protein